MHYYYDAEIKRSTDRLYNDDGKTPYAYEKGMYEILNLKSEIKSHNLIIDINVGLGHNSIFTKKNINLIVHNIQNKPKKVVGYDFEWNEDNHTLKIPVILNKSTLKPVKIKF